MVHSILGKRLSIFSLGSSDNKESQGKESGFDTNPTPLSPSSSSSPGSKEFHSPYGSPQQEFPQALADNPESNIFERSVQDSCICGQPPVAEASLKAQPSGNSVHSRRSRSGTFNSSQFLKQEDYIPPALDATTQLLNDKDTNLDDVEMIYSSRRNSSVLGLNMALGRPFAPSRKSSCYSINQLSNSQPINTNTTTQQNQTQLQSPVSPPKLASTNSSISFYSYADMISNDEFARRPSFKNSYSQGIIPTAKSVKSTPPAFSKHSSFIKHRNPSTLSQLTKDLNSSDSPNQSIRSRFGSIKSVDRKEPANVPKNSVNASNLDRFLISPDSSDSDDQDFVSIKNSKNTSIGGKRKSVASIASSNFGQPPQLTTFNDNESLVSSSIGDCIRQTTTEINGN